MRQQVVTRSACVEIPLRGTAASHWGQLVFLESLTWSSFKHNPVTSVTFVKLIFHEGQNSVLGFSSRFVPT